MHAVDNNIRTIFCMANSTVIHSNVFSTAIDLDLTRFNKIVIPNNKFQMASGQGSHWLIENPTIFALTHFASILFLNIFTLLALTQSFGSLFHSFITLCVEYFFMSNLHCSLTNATLCHLVLLPSLSLKNIFLSTSA